MSTNQTPSDRDSPTPPAAEEAEVRRLAAGVCDGVLTDDEFARLSELLAQHGGLRRIYLQHMAIHSALTSAAGSYALHAGRGTEALPWEAGVDGLLARGATVDLPAELIEVCRTTPRRRGKRRLTAALVLAASVALLAGRVMLHREVKSGSQPVVPSPASERPLVAEITYGSPAAQWKSSNESLALTSRVRAGQVLTLEQGAVELTYDTGTLLRLVGPSEYVVGASGGHLRRGEVRARVTEAGYGFTIETPHGKIIDRGTEFGVVVDDFGVSEVSVIEGRVEAFPELGAPVETPPIDLTQGRSLQWSGEGILALSERQFVNATHRLGRESGDADPHGADVEARDEPDSHVQWVPLGATRPTRGGWVLDGRGVAQRPYLTTDRQFDPAEGAVTLTCDVEFRGVDQLGAAACALLTRCVEQRSKPETPWHDMVASCVRCSLKTDSRTGDGMLDGAAKYEADREPASISWSGFVRPTDGVAYHLEMRDDGLNVSFTASRADNPSIRKTVTCRSLFRGARNLAAIEGVAGAEVRVTNLTIRQARRLAPRNEAADFVAASADAADSRALLDSLAPAKGRLILADDFSGETVSAEHWSALGDVTTKGGRLRLGGENAQGRIDTWHPRPYLVSRRRFDPQRQPLVVVGRASFSANYLQGYGGSFAVLTRAEAEYGVGRGWEQSALRRGVRANFWPAALGQNRSLELFEMLSPEPLRLLASGDFPLTPQRVDYLFQVCDDGSETELTFVDAADPALRKSLRSRTASPVLREGHVALEACWGAPVSIDEVRIYAVPPMQATEEAAARP